MQPDSWQVTVDFHERSYDGVMKKEEISKGYTMEVCSGIGENSYSVISKRVWNNGKKRKKRKIVKEDGTIENVLIIQGNSIIYTEANNLIRKYWTIGLDTGFS